MEDFVVPASIVGLGALIGTIAAWVFDGTMWIGAVIGAGIPIVFILGFYLGILSIIAVAAELFKGGK